MSSRHRLRPTVLAVVAATVLGACTSSSSSTAHSTTPTPRLDLAHAAPAPFHAGGSVGQVYVFGAHAGQNLQLVSAAGDAIA
ncbi:MAG TPA: hypothetical protein VK771_03675, partial [Acidimicrobiia bacterium]|nr:hypothetical protein [Acidimicrobiia bacterium]